MITSFLSYFLFFASTQYIGFRGFHFLSIFKSLAFVPFRSLAHLNRHNWRFYLPTNQLAP